MRRVVRDTILILGRHLRASLRDPGPAFILPTVIPLSGLAIMSQVFREAANVPGFPTEDFIDWMMPGIAILTGMFGGGVMALRMVADHNSGYLDRLRLLPVGNGAVLAGTALFDAVRIIVPAAAAVVLGVALGAPLEAGIGGGAVLVAVAMLWAMTWNSVFLVVGLRTRSEQATQAVVPLFLPLWWTSSVMVPEDLMPGWVEAISSANPVSLLVEGVRPLTLGGGIDTSSFVLGIGVAVGLLVLLQAQAARLFVRLGATS